jgi:hypothetical protein
MRNEQVPHTARARAAATSSVSGTVTVHSTAAVVLTACTADPRTSGVGYQDHHRADLGGASGHSAQGRACSHTMNSASFSSANLRCRLITYCISLRSLTRRTPARHCRDVD